MNEDVSIIAYNIIEIAMFSTLYMNNSPDSSIHTPREIVNAVYNERLAYIENTQRNMALTPISAGTTIAVLDAKKTSLLNAIKIKATTIVDGRVPIMPPVFVPNLSAITVINITMIQENRKGMIA